MKTNDPSRLPPSGSALRLILLAFLAAPLLGETELVSVDFTRIDAPASNVYRLLMDPKEVSTLTKNTSNFVLPPEAAFKEKSSYKRVYFSHGIPNPQTVTVSQADPGRSLTLESDLVGWHVTYRYLLLPEGNGSVLLLKKEATGGWEILKGLMKHLLTRPEHDGDHLSRVKARAESLAR